MLAFIIAVSVIIGAHAELRDWRGTSFQTYTNEFGKAYGREESIQRQRIFEDKLRSIIAHNDEYLAGTHTWYKSLNQFSDWTPAEFASMLKGHAAAPRLSPLRAPSSMARNPPSVDWSRKGVLPEPLDQGSCGSCWAFASTKAIQAHYAIHNNASVPPLSPQTFVNCVKNPDGCGGTGGCEGATGELAFTLSMVKGVATTKDLPYTQEDGDCKPYTPAVKIKDYVKLPTNADPAELENVLATVGPTVVTVAASKWQDYGGGIFKEGCIDRKIFPLNCDLNHGVIVVGYDAAVGYHGYWLISNSWGPEWGERGYIRLSRESDNVTFTDKTPEDGDACKPYPQNQTVRGESGILFDIIYPVGVHSQEQMLV